MDRPITVFTWTKTRQPPEEYTATFIGFGVHTIAQGDDNIVGPHTCAIVQFADGAVQLMDLYKIRFDDVKPTTIKKEES